MSKETYDVNYLYDNFDVEQIREDFGENGYDHAKELSIEELEEQFGDYKLEK